MDEESLRVGSAPSWRKALAPLAALAALVFGLSAAPALGATASVVGNTIDYTAGAGESNNVTISFSGGSYTITESGVVGITPVSPCTPLSSSSVSCPGAGVTHMTVSLADLNDVLNAFPTPATAVPVSMAIEGGLGNDDLTSGNGDDTFTGGPGPAGGCPTPPDLSNTQCDNDNVQGAPGINTVTYAARTTPVGVRLRTGSIGFGGQNCQQDLLTITASSSFPYCKHGEDDHFDGQIQNIIGSPQADALIGSQLSNVINGGPGTTPDVICGGTGTDTVDYSDRTAPVTVTLDGDLPPLAPDVNLAIKGRDTCIGEADPNPARDQSGHLDCIADDGQAGEGDCVGRDIENIDGGSADDNLTGSAELPSVPADPTSNITGANVLSGGQGNDSMNGLSGPDTFIGGSGTDTVSYEDRTESLNATIDDAANDGGASDLETSSRRRDNIGTDVEVLIGGSGGDRLEGSGEGDVLRGGGGDDYLYGGGGDDQLQGDDGNDTLLGAEGNDSLSGGNGDDSLGGGSGADGLDGGANDDSLNGGFGPDSLVGGGGRDSADYSDVTTAVSVTPNGAPDDGRAGEGDNVAPDVEGAVGGPDDDTLVGNGGAGTLDGRGGDDSLDGGGGPDVLIGGPGSDSATYASRSAAVTVDLSRAGGDGENGENDNITTSVEKVVGGSGKDSITGGSSANTLSGGPGDDKLNGGSGFDLVNGGPGKDTLSGGNDTDRLFGDDGNDSLSGDNGTDSLHGGGGNDQLDGGSAADKLFGDGGTDTAMYTARRKEVKITFDGGADDGERREGDMIAFDVLNVKTGSGSDRIDTRDGKRGKVSCGPGRDRVRSDKRDKVARNCETVNGKQRVAKKHAKKRGSKKRK